MAEIQHEDINSSSKIHETKQVAGATTSDAGKIITPSSSSDGTGVLRKLLAKELDFENTTDKGALVESDGDGGSNVIGPQYVYATVDNDQWTVELSEGLSTSLSKGDNLEEDSILTIDISVSGIYCYLLARPISGDAESHENYIDPKLESRTDGASFSLNAVTDDLESGTRLIYYRISG